MELPTFELEDSVSNRYHAVGVDEAGRGPLAGPVVAAAVWRKTNVVLTPEQEKNSQLIRDSKKLSPAQRATAFGLVKELFEVGVGIVSAETIDRVNILQATFLAMRAAVTDLQRKLPKDGKVVLLLLDGNQLLPSYSGEQKAITKGDATVKSIAAASIIAKVTRDTLIEEYDTLYPQYGFANHKGYGTKEHMDALRHFGATPVHRQSFRPVQLTHPEAVNKKFSQVLKPKKGR